MKKYVIRDSEGYTITIYEKNIKDTKIKDVRLEKGDWFTYRKEDKRNVFRLYKVIDDRQLSTNGYTKTILCEEYIGNYDIDKEEYVVKKEGRQTIELSNYLKQNAVKFNSANEALTWIKRQIERYNDIHNIATLE